MIEETKDVKCKIDKIKGKKKKDAEKIKAQKKEACDKKCKQKFAESLDFTSSSDGEFDECDIVNNDKVDQQAKDKARHIIEKAKKQAHNSVTKLDHVRHDLGLGKYAHLDSNPGMTTGSPLDGDCDIVQSALDAAKLKLNSLCGECTNALDIEAKSDDPTCDSLAAKPKEDCSLERKDCADLENEVNGKDAQALNKIRDDLREIMEAMKGPE